MGSNPSFTLNADMLELEDKIVLETIAAMRTGSMPVIGTKLKPTIKIVGFLLLKF